MNINPDITVLIQFVFFIASYWVLSKLAFPPVLEVIIKRKQMIDQANLELKQRDQEGKDMQAEYDGRIRDARLKAQEVRRQARNEASSTERELLEKTRLKTVSLLEQKEKELTVHRTSLLATLDDETKRLSEKIVEKLLEKRS